MIIFLGRERETNISFSIFKELEESMYLSGKDIIEMRKGLCSILLNFQTSPLYISIAQAQYYSLSFFSSDRARGKKERKK